MIVARKTLTLAFLLVAGIAGSVHALPTAVADRFETGRPIHVNAVSARPHVAGHAAPTSPADMFGPHAIDINDTAAPPVTARQIHPAPSALLLALFGLVCLAVVRFRDRLTRAAATAFAGSCRSLDLVPRLVARAETAQAPRRALWPFSQELLANHRCGPIEADETNFIGLLRRLASSTDALPIPEHAISGDVRTSPCPRQNRLTSPFLFQDVHPAPSPTRGPPLRRSHRLHPRIVQQVA